MVYRGGRGGDRADSSGRERPDGDRREVSARGDTHEGTARRDLSLIYLYLFACLSVGRSFRGLVMGAAVVVGAVGAEVPVVLGGTEKVDLRELRRVTRRNVTAFLPTFYLRLLRIIITTATFTLLAFTTPGWR